MDAFVHASGDGFGNTAPLHSDTGAIDMDAISQVAHVTQGAGKLTRKEKKRAKREMKRRKKEAKKAEKEAKKTYSSIKSQLKDRDKELSDKMADARKKRDSAKDVVNYIGYNKMYQDGIHPAYPARKKGTLSDARPFPIRGRYTCRPHRYTLHAQSSARSGSS